MYIEVPEQQGLGEVGRLTKTLPKRPAKPQPSRLLSRRVPKLVATPTLTASPRCGPDVTDWFINEVFKAKNDSRVLGIKNNLAKAASLTRSAQQIAEGLVVTLVLNAEKAAGSPPRSAAANAQLRTVSYALNVFKLWLTGATAGHPSSMAVLALIRRAAHGWRELVGPGKAYDFKAHKMKNPRSAKCPINCPNTITLCPYTKSDCYLTDVPGNLFYAYIGRFVGWTELALQLGSQYAQLTSRRAWDPPEDTLMINIGFNLPDPLTREGLCNALARYKSQLSFMRKPCANCPDKFRF